MLSCLRSRSAGPRHPRGRLHAAEVAQSPTGILSGPFAGSSRPVEVYARRLGNCGRRPTFSAGRVRRGGTRPSDSPPRPAAGRLKSNPRPKKIRTRSGTRAAPTTSNRAPGTKKYPSLCRTTASEPDTASPRPPSHHADARHRPIDLVENDTGGGRDPRRHPRSPLPPSSRPSTNSPTWAIPTFVGEDSRAHAGPGLSSGAAWPSAPQPRIPTSR